MALPTSGSARVAGEPTKPHRPWHRASKSAQDCCRTSPRNPTPAPLVGSTTAPQQGGRGGRYSQSHDDAATAPSSHKPQDSSPVPEHTPATRKRSPGTKSTAIGIASASPPTAQKTKLAAAHAGRANPNLTIHSRWQESTAESSPAPSQGTAPREGESSGKESKNAAATTSGAPTPRTPNTHLCTRRDRRSRVPPPSRRRSGRRRGEEPEASPADGGCKRVASLSPLGNCSEGEKRIFPGG